MLIFQIISLLVIFGSIFMFFYFRIATIKESKKITQQMQSLCDKHSWELTLDRKIKNEIFPLIKGQIDDKDLLIERRLEDKFKYWVISMALDNTQKLHFQVLYKDQIREKDEIGEMSPLPLDANLNKKYILLSNDATFAKELLEGTVAPFWEKHQQISFLFSTVIAFQNRLTLVLVSTTKNLKNDLVIEKSTLWLSNLGDCIEQKKIL